MWKSRFTCPLPCLHPRTHPHPVTLCIESSSHKGECVGASRSRVMVVVIVVVVSARQFCVSPHCDVRARGRKHVSFAVVTDPTQPPLATLSRSLATVMHIYSCDGFLRHYF